MSCNFETESSLSKRAEEYENSNKHGKALETYDKLIQSTTPAKAAVKFAKVAAEIAYIKTKEYERAVKYLRYIIINSDSPEDRLKAQKNIADIYFIHLPSSDNTTAIKEISKLLMLDITTDEKIEYTSNLAKAYFRENNFYQAQVEIDRVLSSLKDKKQRYDLLKLKADIFLSSKNQVKAINIYNEIIKDFPEQSKKDNIGLSLAVCYEDQEKYDKAIEILTELKKEEEKTEYLDLRIKRLKERQALQPGAHGLKK